MGGGALLALQLGALGKAKTGEREELAKSAIATIFVAGIGAYCFFGIGYVLGFSSAFSLSSADPGTTERLKGGLVALLLKFTPLATVTPGATLIWWLLRG